MEKADITKKLFELQDAKYREFHSKLMPDYNKEKIIGIRIPVLKRFLKELNDEAKADFIKELPHNYYEENNLHGFIIGNLSDFDECVRELNRFLPYVDNWATCDSLRPKCFKKHKDSLKEQIEIWMKSNEEYTVRFAIEMLMVHFLDEDFSEVYPQMISEIKSDKYYINMMIAWYFATALSKKWDTVIPYIIENKLSFWVHNKAIQKSCESYRFTDEQKNFLKKFKRKAE